MSENLAKQRKLGDDIVRPSLPSAKKWIVVHDRPVR